MYQLNNFIYNFCELSSYILLRNEFLYLIRKGSSSFQSRGTTGTILGSFCACYFLLLFVQSISVSNGVKKSVSKYVLHIVKIYLFHQIIGIHKIAHLFFI